MSVKIMGLVWEADLPQREKFVLLAYADHADHEGNNVFPSVGLIAWKTGYSSRSVQRITQAMVDGGILIEDGQHDKYGTNKYKIAIEKLPKLPPYGRGVKLSPSAYGGDILTGDNDGRGDKSTSRGDKMPPGGDTAMSPEPSFKPSIKPSLSEEEEFTAEIFGRLEIMAGGTLNMNTVNTVDEWMRQYPREWVDEALGIAEGNGASSPNYVTKVLENWFQNGKEKRKGKSKSTGLMTADEILAIIEASKENGDD